MAGLTPARSGDRPMDSADALGRTVLPDHAGHDTLLSDLWHDEPVALVWLRHYG